MHFVASHKLFGTCWLLKLDSQKVKAYVIIPLYKNNRFANIRFYEMQNLRDTVPVNELLPLANISSTFLLDLQIQTCRLKFSLLAQLFPMTINPRTLKNLPFSM